ncbi:two-component system phosphate regulon sensor histidine kinase PhoR [Salibacterium salarium]|uniref:two-component system histidine kinase PnpS n=1 Tax=Salibacterium salarium TaxID=284579 RepID=UPI002789BA68|nr:ATP-binding protein [Salibacterium salarium]MDQ0298591.1 two-component system phosphate regulon sensor histidine kinase PhoR [Salibacterium salarium]
MMKFRTRLIFGLLIVTLFVMAALGILIGQLLKGFYVEQLEERLGKEASLASLAIEDVEENNRQEFAEDIMNRLDVRVTVLKENGEVEAETEEKASSTEVDIDVPEFEEIDESGGTSIRNSAATGNELLFYAAPVNFEDDQGYLRLAMPVERIKEVNQQIWMFIAISFSLAFIVIMTLSYRIANQLTRPIGQVTDVANELAKGNFKARTYVGSKDEVGQLTRSINILAYNLDQITSRYQTQQERLETLIDNMGSGLIFINDRGDITLINQYCKDIFDTDTDQWLHLVYHKVIEDQTLIKLIQQIFLTETKVRRQVQLNSRLEVHHYDVYGAPIVGEKERLRGIVLVLHDITELKKLEQVRKDFVANVSHELKTPVTSLKGFTETLLDGAMDDQKARKQFLDIIWKEGDRLQDLITDLLELSRIEQEFFQLNWQSVDVTTAFQEVVDLLDPRIKEKGLEFTVNKQENLVMEGDTARFKQILINLMNNAIVYTPENGYIHAEVIQEGMFILLIVQDSGIGISKEEWPRIFERFYRVDKDRSRNSGGTGLGLAIVKHLVEAHNGSIDVESEKDKGTTFKIYFPEKRLKE